MDGTFKTGPSFFYQMYTIHGDADVVMVPLVSDKKEQNYYRMFVQIKEATPDRIVETVYADLR